MNSKAKMETRLLEESGEVFGLGVVLPANFDGNEIEFLHGDLAVNECIFDLKPHMIVKVRQRQRDCLALADCPLDRGEKARESRHLLGQVDDFGVHAFNILDQIVQVARDLDEILSARCVFRQCGAGKATPEPHCKIRAHHQ